MSVDDRTLPVVPVKSWPRALQARHGRKLTFACVGATGLIIGTSVLYFLANIEHINPSVAYLIQTIVAVEINYVGSDFLTWRDRHGSTPWYRRWARFHTARVGLMVPVNQVMFYVLHPILGTLLAQLVCVTAATIANYLLNDRLVFRQPKSVTAEEASTND